MNKFNKLSLEKKDIPNFLIIIRLILTIFIVALLIGKFYKVPGDITIYSIKDIFAEKSLDNEKIYCSISLYQLLAGILFVIACLSDFLDGYVARKHNWVSHFGKIWDPIADKVLINSVLICFTVLKFIPIFISIIMIARDVIIDAKRMFDCKQNADVSANIYGKLKTILQMWGIIFIFFICCFTNEDNTHNKMWWFGQNLLMYTATIMSIFSGSYYLFAKNIHDDHKN